MVGVEIMKYYKNLVTGQVFAFEADGSQDDFIPSNLVAMTPQEVQAHITPPPLPPKTQFTSLEFLDRFTEAEQIAVVTATLANAQVKLWYDKMLAASFVDLEDPRTEGGLNALVLSGLITQSRKNEILEP
jgi:hypothetical protein